MPSVSKLTLGKGSDMSKTARAIEDAIKQGLSAGMSEADVTKVLVKALKGLISPTDAAEGSLLRVAKSNKLKPGVFHNYWTWARWFSRDGWGTEEAAEKTMRPAIQALVGKGFLQSRQSEINHPKDGKVYIIDIALTEEGYCLIKPSK